MYEIKFEGKACLEEVKKFAVSKDCVLSALVLASNKILVQRLFDHDTYKFIDSKKFAGSQSVFVHRDSYKEVIDLFIFKN